MATPDPLDTFGQFLMENLRDRGIDHLDGLLARRWKAPSLRPLQTDLKHLTPEQRDLVRRAFISSLDSALHDFLFALHEQSDSKGPIAVRVRGKNIAALSDGLHGELFTEDGWFARFSEFGNATD